MVGAERLVGSREVAFVGIDRERRPQRTSANRAIEREECAAALAARDARVGTDFRTTIATFQQGHECD